MLGSSVDRATYLVVYLILRSGICHSVYSRTQRVALYCGGNLGVPDLEITGGTPRTCVLCKEIRTEHGAGLIVKYMYVLPIAISTPRAS